MKVDQRALARLEELVRMGDQVLATRQSPPANTIGFPATVNSQSAHQWFTSVQSILVRVLGPNSEHYKNFSALGEKGLNFSPVNQAQGVLKAAIEDIRGGFLFDVRRLIEAEVFDDLLDQSAELLDAGYHQPAAVIAGCVLEDGLRKLCTTNGITLSDKPKLDSMNSELERAGAYNKLTQKRITSIADIRNSAAHGKWDQFAEADVRDALSWIRGFMESHFA